MPSLTWLAEAGRKSGLKHQRRRLEMSGDYKFDTLSLHAGHVPDERHGSRAVPIHQTTSYVFQNTEHAAALYNQELGGHLDRKSVV